MQRTSVSGGASICRTTTISVADHGASPGSGGDAVPAVRRALGAATRVQGPVVLEFPPGRYDFHPQHATGRRYHVSNTTSEAECADPTKAIAILVERMADLTINGNGSDWVFHGRQTMLVLDKCDRVRIRNVGFDFARPTTVELTVESILEDKLDVRVHRDTRYEVINGEVRWTGPGWSFTDGPAQVYSPAEDATWRIRNPLIGATGEQLGPGRLRFHGGDQAGLAPGYVLQIRDGLRDQVGILATQSTGVALEDVNIHYAHGLALVAQYCEDLTLERLTVAPREDSGRTAASFADIVHVSGCRGTVRVTDSTLTSAHDDAINVHGTHLAVTAQPAPDQLVVRFMHPQTYGMAGFFSNDEIAVVDAATLLPRSTHRVLTVEPLGSRARRLTLDSPVPVLEDGDVVENITWNPAVEVLRTRFARIPTRGILVNTRRAVRIEHNTFERIGLSGILIADDAASWYESGPVTDVTIRGNRFLDCGAPDHPVIAVAPENTIVDLDQPVHRNITITDNVIVNAHAPVLQAKSTHGITVTGNTIVDGNNDPEPPTTEQWFEFVACRAVEVSGNRVHISRQAAAPT